MNAFKKSLIALAGLALLASFALLVVTLAHSLAPVGAASAERERGQRKFYLTRTSHDGAEALTACAAGYHMASVWEILDPSNLRYDTGLGFTAPDSGFGPPTTAFGWIRTGRGANFFPSLGESNCNAWASASSFDYGTSVGLGALGTPTSVGVSNPWLTGLGSCDSKQSVWCVQD